MYDMTYRAREDARVLEGILSWLSLLWLLIVREFRVYDGSNSEMLVESPKLARTSEK